MALDASPKARGVIALYTDGACKGNPGPGGWGALLQTTTPRQGLVEKALCGGAAQTTNNRMELMAVIEGLKAIKRPSHVTVYLDSQYVRQGVTEWLAQWKARGWKTAGKQPVKNVDLWMALDEVVSHAGHTISWQWVKGHAGHPGNERADDLANQGVAPYTPYTTHSDSLHVDP